MTHFPVIRYEGVSTSSRLEGEMLVRGLELIIDFTSTMTVCSLSSENLAWPVNFLRQRFVLLIRLSKTPPHQGAFSMLNSHSVPLMERWLIMVWSLKTPSRKTAAALKLFPLSERIFFGIPLLAANHSRHLMKESVDVLVIITSSKWSTLVQNPRRTALAVANLVGSSS